MRRINSNPEAVEQLADAILTAGAISALSALLEHMMQDEGDENSQIAEQLCSPFFQGHLVHSIQVLAKEIGGTLEGVQEHLEQPLPLREVIG